MRNKIENFFEFNKQKVIISLLWIFIISVIRKFFFQYNLKGGIINENFLNLVYPVEFLYRIIFAPFLDINKINNSFTYRLISAVFGSAFILFLKTVYFYSIACFLFWLKNKFIKGNKV